MAGNYADAPSWRMAYDRDGTQAFKRIGGNLTSLTQAEIANMNRESGGGYTGFVITSYGTQTMVLIFPEHRDVDAATVFCWGLDYSLSNVSVSKDTTNGVDGTWTNYSPTGYNQGSNLKPGYRTGIKQTTFLGIKAIAFDVHENGNNYGGSYGYFLCHLYGEPVPGENPDRLEIWHPTLDQRVGPAYFDWGDTPRGSSDDLTFRVKNISSAKTALSVRVAMEALTDTSPTVLSQEALSLDGSSWLAQVNVGDLAPGEISAQTVTLRRTLVDNATMGLWSFRVFAESTSAWV